jgi:hypothetical protein
VVTANTANSKADQAIAAVSNSINYQLKANVAAIPASPANDTYIEIQDSTGLESFTPLAGMPAGFVGDSGLSVRLRYTTAGTTWNWLNYYANNSDSRYLKLTGGTLTGQIKADDSTSAATPGYAFDGDPNTGIGRPGVDELALITGGTARLTIDSSGSVSVAGALTKGGNNVVTVGDTGTVTSAMVADGTLVNADINASAAIAGTKISPDFGSQNTTTTGTSTAASFIPSSSTAPSNGVYLPSANNVAISTNGTGALFIDSSGNVGVGAAPDGKLSILGANSNTPRLRIQHPSNDKDAAISAYFDGGGTYLLTGSNHYLSSTGSNAKFDATSGSSAWYLDGSGLGIFYNSSGSGSIAERLRIRADGTFEIKGGGTAGTSPAVSVNPSASANSLVIDSSGRVGLGTSSPGYLLDVNGAIRTGGSNLDGTLNFRTAAGANEAGWLSVGAFNWALGTDFAISAGSGRSLLLGSNNARAITIDTSQRVGIGTTSPNRQLEVATAGTAYIRAADTTNSVNMEMLAASSGGWIGTQTNHSLNFQTNNTERARIDTSGRLLVGTSDGSGSVARLIVQGASNSSPVTQFQIAYNGNANSGFAANGTLGEIRFTDQASNSNLFAVIKAETDGVTGTNDYPGRLTFSTTADGASSPTERMRITNNGLTYQYSTSAGYACSISAAAGTTQEIFIGQHSSTGISTGTTSYKVFSNGNVQNTNNSYTALSDIKLKENIVDAGSQWADIKALRVRNYNLKEGQTHRQIGLVAQEVEPISPGLVYESPDRDAEGNDLGTNTKAVQYSVLYMKAVKALQEAMERIEQLETEMAEVKAQLQAS